MSLFEIHRYNYKLCKLVKVNLEKRMNRLEMYKKVYRYMKKNNLIIYNENSKLYRLNNELAEALGAYENTEYTLLDLTKLIKNAIVEEIYEL